MVIVSSACRPEQTRPAKPDPGFEVSQPVIPARDFCVAHADGDATRSIQETIDQAASAGGGRVILPSGRFLSGPLKLASKIDFHFENGAVLVMSDDPADFPAEGNRRPAFISVSGASDIRISGKGIIEGQGEKWWNDFLELKRRGEDKQAPRRPQLIAIDDCQRVVVESVTTRNPPNTHYSFRRCTDLFIQAIRAEAPDDSPNTDALNLNGARRVVISDCDISTGDDNIVLLCGEARQSGVPEVEDVVIRDCRLGFGHGISIGSHTIGGIRNVVVSDVSFDGTTSGIRMKARADNGGVVENIRYRNIRMKNVRYPVFVTSHYPKVPPHPSQSPRLGSTAKIPLWRNIAIESLAAEGCRNSIILWGTPREPIRNLTMRNVQIAAEAGALVFHATDVRFEDVMIRPEEGPALRTFDAQVAGMAGEDLGPQPVRFR